MMLTLENRGDAAAVIAGRLYATDAPAAQQFFDRLARTVTIDCSRLEYISSAGLSVLSKTQSRLLKIGAKLRLVGASRHLSDVLQLSGLDMLVEVEPA